MIRVFLIAAPVLLICVTLDVAPVGAIGPDASSRGRGCPDSNVFVTRVSCSYGVALMTHVTQESFFPCLPVGAVGKLRVCHFHTVFRHRRLACSFHIEPGDGSVSQYICTRGRGIVRRFEYG
jgi:hypothetical protein